MELTLVGTELDRSLQRRWALTEAEPVPAALHPNETFIPADLRIWWQVADGKPAGADTLHANAWPAEREPHRFADWRDERNMPCWIRGLSTIVHADVLANTTSQNTGSEDRWAHCLKRKWVLEGADVLPVSRYNREQFVPADLSIWWSFNVGLPRSEHRYSIYAHSAGRDRKTAQWGSSRSAFNYGNDELPEWIRELAEAQYEELAATAIRFEMERGEPVTVRHPDKPVSGQHDSGVRTHQES